MFPALFYGVNFGIGAPVLVAINMPAEMDPMDARYSVIQWVHRSDPGFSVGQSFSDPSTGEIIKAALKMERLADAAAPALYEKSRQALDPAIGLLNTLILLTSGWLMVQAVAAGRDGDRPRVLRFLALTVLVGCGFALTKVLEYATKIRAGISMLTNEFFMYYFILTGIHFLHFVIGIIVLVVCLMKARREPLDARFTVWFESAGSYWHMVDLLWIVLFPLLYLLR